MHASGEHVRKGPQAVDFRSALQFYLIDCTTLPGKLIDILIVFFNMEWIHIARKRDIVCPQCGLSTMMMTHRTANPAAMSFSRNMMADKALKGWIVLILTALITGTAQGSDDQAVSVGRFSAMTPGGRVSGWEPMIFGKIESHTRYTLVEDEGRTVLRADSRASASGLVKKMDLDPSDHPVLTWDWKISNTISNGDVAKKSGDDYAARIYITFAENPDRLSFFQRAKMGAIKMLYGQAPPSAALAYVWGNRAEVGSLHPSPYTKQLQMIVVESGPDHQDQWRSARQDIVKDFQRAFGTDPPRLTGIAVMTDTDNTGASATAWYGDIVFRQRELGGRKTED
jgi:hypothetical protein